MGSPRPLVTPPGLPSQAGLSARPSGSSVLEDLGQDLAQGLLKGHKTHLENPPLLWGLQGGWAHRASAAYMRAQSCTHTTRAQVYACTRVHTRTSGPAQLEGSSWTLCLAPGALPALSRAPVPRPAPHCWCSRGCTRSPLRAATDGDGEPAVGNPHPRLRPRGSGSDMAGPSTLSAAPVQGRTAALQRGGCQAWTRGQPFSCPGLSPPDPPCCPPSPLA